MEWASPTGVMRVGEGTFFANDTEVVDLVVPTVENLRKVFERQGLGLDWRVDFGR